MFSIVIYTQDQNSYPFLFLVATLGPASWAHLLFLSLHHFLSLLFCLLQLLPFFLSLLCLLFSFFFPQPLLLFFLLLGEFLLLFGPDFFPLGLFVLQLLELLLLLGPLLPPLVDVLLELLVKLNLLGLSSGLAKVSISPDLRTDKTLYLKKARVARFFSEVCGCVSKVFKNVDLISPLDLTC